jgi:hypothetical protein
MEMAKEELWNQPVIPIPGSDLLEGLIFHTLNGRQCLIPVAMLSRPFGHRFAFESRSAQECQCSFSYCRPLTCHNLGD